MKSALLFLFKLPFRILALPIVILLFGLSVLGKRISAHQMHISSLHFARY